jgi:hypothetical protein
MIRAGTTAANAGAFGTGSVGKCQIPHRAETKIAESQTLGQVCAKCDWRVHAYCLMTNHFHLVVETPSANLVAGMKLLGRIVL